ncbi:MAG TPA: aspartate dehydrogenase [Euryarchaeota archaeon]|nr:MAG: aspartate dehydrogenase [Thermoplasmata archaeon]HDD60334.1 aspartate dehydrogenase [Euryarchaeota archaeon]
MRIGILGCGFIGTTIAKTLEGHPKVTAINLFDIDDSKSKGLSLTVEGSRYFPFERWEEFIEESDLVVEAASHRAVETYARETLKRGKDIMILSVGALADDALWEDMKRLAEERGGRIFIPSGAISGIDGIKSASLGRIEEVVLTTIKPPKGLKGSEVLAGMGLNLNKHTSPVTVYEGPAREAVKLFPQNVNVAATLSIAGIGFDKTRVRIVVDPAATTNRHEIYVKGRFGEMHIVLKNVPSMTNPKSSYLAPLSAIATIEKILSGIYVGT